jgi:hypothetical protein
MFTCLINLVLKSMVSRDNCLLQMYVASDNNAANCSGGCTKLWTGGPPRTSANWLSELEKQIEEYAYVFSHTLLLNSVIC